MKIKFTALFLALITLSSPAQSSPWAEKETYGEKAGGKAIFGAKNLLLGWTTLFTEPVKYRYYLEKKKSWQGLCVGISKTVLYTATGAIQLVTFPIPVDFPNMGEGVLNSSIKEQAEREQGKKKDASNLSETVTVDAQTEEKSPAPALKPPAA